MRSDVRDTDELSAGVEPNTNDYANHDAYSSEHSIDNEVSGLMSNKIEPINVIAIDTIADRRGRFSKKDQNK